jgi:alkylation response protein AidB-like acyl-CoA dehydrogenase
MAKLFTADIAMKLATDAAQLFGSSGISKDNRIEQYFRDAKVLQIIEGTNQIQRNLIGKYVVKTY